MSDKKDKPVKEPVSPNKDPDPVPLGGSIPKKPPQ